MKALFLKVTCGLLMATTALAGQGVASGGMSGSGGNAIDDMMLESIAKIIDQIPQASILRELSAKVTQEINGGVAPTNYHMCMKHPVLYGNWFGWDGPNYSVGSRRLVFMLDAENIGLFVPNSEQEPLDWKSDPELSRVVREASNCIAATFIRNLIRNQSLLFFFANRDLSPLAKENLGIPFDSDQTAIQTKNEVFIDLKKFSAMDELNQRILILHEVVQYNLKQIAKMNMPGKELSPSSLHSMTRYLTVQLNLYLNGRIPLQHLKSNLQMRMLADDDLVQLM